MKLIIYLLGYSLSIITMAMGYVKVAAVIEDPYRGFAIFFLASTHVTIILVMLIERKLIKAV